MNVKIYALKKDGGKFEKAVEFNPALISLGETVQEVIGNATFHEWASVLVEFEYEEREEKARREFSIALERARAGKFFPSEHRLAIEKILRDEGTPADSVAFTKPPVFS